MNRRTVLISASAIASARPATAQSCDFEVCRSGAEWRARLTEDEHLVLGEEESERPHASPIDAEKREGVYRCRGGTHPVYASEAKYDSGAGWPSFFESLPVAVRTRQDRRLLFQVRTEVHCRRCGSHLGHVFDDGPEPTGKRHCLNGLSLEFVPA